MKNLHLFLKKSRPPNRAKGYMLLWRSLDEEYEQEKEERDQLYKEDIKRSPRCRE